MADGRIYECICGIVVMTGDNNLRDYQTGSRHRHAKAEPVGVAPTHATVAKVAPDAQPAATATDRQKQPHRAPQQAPPPRPQPSAPVQTANRPAGRVVGSTL